MKSYLIDEISEPEIEKIREYLNRYAISSNIEGVFWVTLPEDILSPTQIEHTECRPHVIAAELGPNWIKLEFFVRSLKNMKCTCPGFCTKQQKNHVMKFGDKMIETLEIKI